ncbi:MAG: N-formylglutamate amidohydrolase [Janthinobacterium lividum]
MTISPFDQFGPAIPASPVVLSVPHAGRDYPAALRAALLAPMAAAQSLEDRHVDAVALAALGAETMVVQRLARAWIDLNRREDERDPAVDDGAPMGVATPAGPAGAKLRSGLGLVPRRAGTWGDLWHRRWTDAEIAARIASDHRPYHAALASALAAARDRFGVAMLVDLHSMPPLTDARPAGIVIGDRHGTSAHPALARAVEAAAARAGIRTVRNHPYIGGHIVERHGRPADGIHAVQIEIDRSLYLDRTFDRPAADGVARIARVVRAAIDAAVQAVGVSRPAVDPLPLAAE